MKIKHIFFDLDNTLWDHRKNALLTLKALFDEKEIGKIGKIRFEDFHHQYEIVNEDLWAQLRDGHITKDYLRKNRFYTTFLFFEIDDQQLSDYFEIHFLDQIINYNELVPESLDILQYLKEKGYDLHVVSNGFREVTHRKIENAQLKNFFETITSAEDVNAMKPHPKIFEFALQEAQAKKENSIFIGDDWIADVIGAQNFGLEVIYFDVLGENKREKTIRTISKLSEIKQFL